MKEQEKAVSIKEDTPKKHLFAETSVASKAENYSLKPMKYTAEEIITLLELPQANALRLQQVSLWLYFNSGIYNRLINNYAGMNIYDLYLFPSTIGRLSKKKVKQDTLFKDYLNVATTIENMNIKANFRNVGINLLVQGEVFLYEVSDSQGVILKEIPSDMCKICKVINDNLYKYAINITKLGTQAVYDMMPIKLQQLYDKHSAGTIPPEQYVDSSYVIVEDDEAVCLSLSTLLGTKSVPPLSYLFPSLIRLMDEESNEIVESKANNLKLIHMKYPVDDEGESVIDTTELKKMHNSAKSNLPMGVAINTNPLEVTTHTLQRTANAVTTNRQTLTELVYNNSGVNSELFNGNQSNNQAILSGITSDEIYCDTLNSLFENYVKYRVKRVKKNSLWIPRFIRNTKYNATAVLDEAFKCCTVGLSRMKLMACQHYSPLEALSILDFEVENGIDELFVPLATAYTQSAQAMEESGRPKNSETSDTNKSVGDDKNSTN